MDFYSSRSKWLLLPVVTLSGGCVWCQGSALLHTQSPSSGSFAVPEGGALNEMCLLNLSQKVHQEEEEDPPSSESARLSPGCVRWRLSSSSFPQVSWAHLSHFPVETASLCFSSHSARGKERKHKATVIIVFVVVIILITIYSWTAAWITLGPDHSSD